MWLSFKAIRFRWFYCFRDLLAFVIWRDCLQWSQFSDLETYYRDPFFFKLYFLGTANAEPYSLDSRVDTLYILKPLVICFPILAGMTNISCHKKFQKCVNRLSKSIKQSKNIKVGFSKQCPYSVVIPTVNQGMDIGIMFSQLGNDMRTELWVLEGITLVIGSFRRFFGGGDYW